MVQQPLPVPPPQSRETRMDQSRPSHTPRRPNENDDNTFSDADQWEQWIKEYAPRNLSRSQRKQWITDRELDRGAILPNIPRQIKQAINTTPHLQDGEIIHVQKPNGEAFYARLQKRLGQLDLLHVLFLDASRYPHSTGLKEVLRNNMQVTRVALWEALNRHYQAPLSGDTPDEEVSRTSIIGPTTTAFPLNDGWYLRGQHPRKDEEDNGPPRSLSDLTIHTMTDTLTKQVTKGVRPNCEKNWEEKWPRAYAGDWTAIWKSIGTPLSDPTEENAWKRLLQRAWDARNRHPKKTDKTCRLLCGYNDESMLHMVKCPHATPFWKACAAFSKNILQTEIHPRGIYEAVVFNTAGSSAKMLPESTRAFLRHAVGRFYAAVTAIKEEGGIFRWQTTYHWTLLKFRDAAMRWACGIKLQFARRRFSHLTEHVPQATLSLYPALITFRNEGRSFSVASALTQEINRAEAAALGRAEANTGQ